MGELIDERAFTTRARPRPSPTYVCTSPSVPARIAATLAEAAVLARPAAPGHGRA